MNPLALSRNVGLVTVVMAAGKGTRMKSDLAKVLHPIGGRPMIQYVVETAMAVGSERILTIVGHQAEAVMETLAGYPVEFVEQRELLGTGHAVMQASPHLGGYEGDMLALAGDTPLLRPETLSDMVTRHRFTQAAVTLLTARIEKPFGFGRIVRDPDGRVVRIVEEKDTRPEEKNIREVNTSTYCFQTPLLLEMLTLLKPLNQQGEYYPTDTVGLLHERGYRVEGIAAEYPEETLGINTPEQLAFAGAILARRV